ncbi:MAG: hypothetical protein JJU00_14920 [Opitutales bacterium]|nr:hypothetical protein [Opitutales bacterium]
MTKSHYFRSFLTAFSLSLVASPAAVGDGGPFPPHAGQPGSTAVALGDHRIVAWAERMVSVEWGEDLSEEWKAPERALGPASGNIVDVVSLGRGGRITYEMALPVIDRAGPDFAVFGNSHNDFFLELAFVEVSSDGEHFVRFPNSSLTKHPVPAFGSVDPTMIDGFAGKYRAGHAVPFDLADLRGEPGAEYLDFDDVRYIRLVDVVGGTDERFTSLPQSRDSEGRPVYDPFPTVASAGFDLDGIAVFHSELRAEPGPGGITLRWRAQPGASTRVLRSTDLREWSVYDTSPPAEAAEHLWLAPIGAEERVFFVVAPVW